MTTYAIVVFDDAEELDFVGPWEAFTVSEMLRNGGTVTPGAVFTVGGEMGPVRCNKGLRVLVDHTFADAPTTDVLLVPGGQGTRRQATNATILEWLAARAAVTTWMTSVCTGSYLLVTSGVAVGKRVATHWSFEDTLEATGKATVVRDARWVRDGQVVTSQGVSAGIDMALWLVGQLHGRDHARAVQRYMQYDPAPPYQAEV
jgi:transcriptional regulator GlxA family with amidase domain